jgi:hypothetical protein
MAQDDRRGWLSDDDEDSTRERRGLFGRGDRDTGRREGLFRREDDDDDRADWSDTERRPERRRDESFGRGQTETSGGSAQYGGSGPVGGGMYSDPFSGRDRERFRQEDENGGRDYRERMENQMSHTPRPGDQGDRYSAGLWGEGGPQDRTDTGMREQAGRFVGKGPKNFSRSDARIEEDVHEKLAAHPELDATDIEVEVANGEVTLSGSVTERQSRRLAEDIVEAIVGVRHVQNNIRVGSSVAGTLTAGVANAAKAIGEAVKGSTSVQGETRGRSGRSRNGANTALTTLTRGKKRPS